MILSFVVDEITDKEADDIVDELISFIRDDLNYLVTDYFVEEV